MKTKAQIEHAKRHHTRYRQKHPEKVLARLEKWIEKEKDPEEKKKACKIRDYYLKKIEQKKIDEDEN